MIWPPVLLDCMGAPEPNPAGIIYRVKAASKDPIGIDADGNTIYVTSGWIEVDRTGLLSSSYVIPDPPPGSVNFVTVAATDDTGNISEECL